VVPGGYFGQALIVDVAGQSATGTPLELDERVLRERIVRRDHGMHEMDLHVLEAPGFDQEP